MPPLRKRRRVSMICASGITTEDDYLHLYYVTRSKKKRSGIYSPALPPCNPPTLAMLTITPPAGSLERK